MPDRPHHSKKWHDCVDKVMAQGHDKSSAAAICTSSLEESGHAIYETEIPPGDAEHSMYECDCGSAMRFDGSARCPTCGRDVDIRKLKKRKDNLSPVPANLWPTYIAPDKSEKPNMAPASPISSTTAGGSTAGGAK